MPKRIYQIGEPCDKCNTPTIKGKDGNGYCWPCWAKWKDAQKAPQTAQAPRMAQSPTQAPIVQPSAAGASSQRIIELLESIDAKLEEIRYNSVKADDGTPIPF